MYSRVKMYSLTAICSFPPPIKYGFYKYNIFVKNPFFMGTYYVKNNILYAKINTLFVFLAKLSYKAKYDIVFLQLFHVFNIHGAWF